MKLPLFARVAVVCLLAAAAAGVIDFASAQERPPFPALMVTTIDTEDPIQVGQSTVYICTVENKGGKAATDVRVTMKLPKELIISGLSSTNARVEAITFSPIRTLVPGGKATFTIAAAAVDLGSVKVESTVTYREYAKSVIDTEGTSVY